MGGGGKGGSQTIGYKYYLGVHMIICHGPVDKVGPIYAGQRPAYSGSAYYDGTSGNPRPILTPPSGWELQMLMTDSSINGTLSPWSNAQNITNVSFGATGATFTNGYMDIGDFVPATSGVGWNDDTKFTMIFVFTPNDAGDDLQCLIGKHTSDATGGRDIFCVWWQRSKGRVGITYGRKYLDDPLDLGDDEHETEDDITWISDENAFLAGVEHEVMILWRTTEWEDDEGGSSEYNTSVGLYRNAAYIGSASYTGHTPSSWIGRSWVVGADWDEETAARDNEYNGTMKDLYIWSDILYSLSEMWPVTSTPGASEQRIYINNPELFGGEKKEGGIVGTVDVMFGADGQEQNNYLLSQPGISSANLPGYRGVISLVANQVYICAMSPYPKPWWVRIENIPGKDWYPTKAEINPTGTGTSANAAHMIRECILNDEWGMGYTTSSIDEGSFEATADTLYDEGFGLSMILASQGSIEEFIQEILKHVNGVLYTDRETGLFVLNLIRDDYVIGDLPVFNESNIVKLESYQRPTYAEMVNEVTIVYRKRGDFQDSSVTFQDLASVQAQGGVVSQTRNFSGIDDSTIASKVGMRELRQQSTPLAQVQLTVNREGWAVNPGEAIVFEWPEYGITQMVLRILKADYGEVLSGQIKFTCVEDVFGLPAATYMEPQDSIWEDPVDDPTPVPESWLQEATYFEIATGIPNGAQYVETMDPGAAFLIYMAKPPAVASSSYELWTYVSPNSYTLKNTGGYTPTAELVVAANYGDDTFVLSSLPTGADSIAVNDYAFIGNEIVRIDGIDLENVQITVGRGCIDTIPQRHNAGADIWFGKTSWCLDWTEYADGNTVYAKALPQTGFGVLDIGDATQESIAMEGRAYKPYPIAKVAFQTTSNYFPTFVYGANATLVHFANRNRIQQSVPENILDWFDSNITAEANVEYTFRWFCELDINDNQTQATRIDTGVTGTSHSWDRADELADSNLGEFTPPDDWDLHMPLANDEIGGTLSPWTQAQNVTNCAFIDRAEFLNGYLDFGDFALSTTSFTITFMFQPENTGEDYQLLIGKHTISGSGGADIFSLYWRRSDKRFYFGYGTTRSSVGTTGDVRPGRKHEVMITRNGSTTAVYLSGKLLGSRSFTISSWTGRSWVLGADWDASDPIRNDLYYGTMWDLRIWNNVVKTAADIWPTERVNRYFRLVVNTIRSGENSLQDFDFTVTNRGGWGLDWGNKFNGRNV
jgi:hypothetical protein